MRLCGENMYKALQSKTLTDINVFKIINFNKFYLLLVFNRHSQYIEQVLEKYFNVMYYCSYKDIDIYNTYIQLKILSFAYTQKMDSCVAHFIFAYKCTIISS